jgi:cytochrome c oxidase cbb3-type subunit 3
LFYITLVFGGIYLALYPGLGSFAGYLGWSDTNQYDDEMARAAETYDPIFKKYAAVSIEELAKGEEYEDALFMGKRMYLSYCSQCHGSTATGARGYPNLADSDWLWGGEPKRIKESILQGRSGVMPPYKGRVNDEQLEQLVAYTLSLSGREVDAGKTEAGKTQFTTLGCIGCHGVDGTGNIMLGAPNLTDTTWLYGGSEGAIKQTILEGRNGIMPAQREFLGEDKSHLIAAYIYSLSAQ